MRRPRFAVKSIVALAAVMVMVVASAPLVSAEVVPAPPGVQASSSPTAPVKLVGTGAGQGVNGFMSTLTPQERLGGYPQAIQPGWGAHNVGFAGLIRMQVTSGPATGATFDAYCIDLLTPTNVNNNYRPGEWNEANVPNVGYVAQLLQSYFPTTSLPAGPSNNARAAAVQAAIWYFSDGFVLPSNASLYATVRDIVTDVIQRGPLTSPPPPTLTISGPSAGRANAIVGPFVVNTDGATAVGKVPAGVEAFADPTGATPLASPFPVNNGQEIWLRGTQAGLEVAALSVTAIATQPGGAVYLFVPPQSNPNARAQTIIQAGPLTAQTEVNKPVVFFDIGQFTITKTITGDGAGQQGPIQIDIVCSTPNSTIPPFTIPGGEPAGVVTTVVTGITVPARCHVTERASGDTEIVDVYAEPAATVRELAPRRLALGHTQALSVCPDGVVSQPLSASVDQELQAATGASFENFVEATTTTSGSTTSSSDGSTTSSTDGSTTSSIDGTTTSSSTSSTVPTTPTTPTTAPTTTVATTTSTTTTSTTTTGATTTPATTTAATTTAATTTTATTALVPTTAENECEFSGDTTTTTGPETLPATGSSGSAPLAAGLIGVVTGLGLVALASRRRLTD